MKFINTYSFSYNKKDPFEARSHKGETKRKTSIYNKKSLSETRQVTAVYLPFFMAIFTVVTMDEEFDYDRDRNLWRWECQKKKLLRQLKQTTAEDKSQMIKLNKNKKIKQVAEERLRKEEKEKFTSWRLCKDSINWCRSWWKRHCF